MWSWAPPPPRLVLQREQAVDVRERELGGGQALRQAQQRAGGVAAAVGVERAAGGVAAVARELIDAQLDAGPGLVLLGDQAPPHGEVLAAVRAVEVEEQRDAEARERGPADADAAGLELVQAGDAGVQRVRVAVGGGEQIKGPLGHDGGDEAERGDGEHDGGLRAPQQRPGAGEGAVRVHELDREQQPDVGQIQVCTIQAEGAEVQRGVAAQRHDDRHAGPRERHEDRPDRGAQADRVQQHERGQDRRDEIEGRGIDRQRQVPDLGPRVVKDQRAPEQSAAARR